MSTLWVFVMLLALSSATNRDREETGKREGDISIQKEKAALSAHSTADNFQAQRRRTQISPLSTATQFIRNAWQNPLSLFGCDNENEDEIDDTNSDVEGEASSIFDCDDDGGTDGDNDGSPFTITLDLRGVPDDKEFRNAVSKWSKVIVGDLPDWTESLEGSSSCGAWPSSVDDVYICGKYEYIDGPSGVLGSASPRHYRPTEGLPITGEMRFDSIDIQGGSIRDLLGVIVSVFLTPRAVW